MDACPSCGQSLPPGALRCSNCKKVFGEANRCPACQAIAAAHEVAEGHLVCAACGAPRQRKPGTVVDEGLADSLAREARVSGLTGLFARLAALGLGVLGVSAGGLQAAFDFGHPGLTMALFMTGAAGLFFVGGRMQARKTALQERALERRLLSEVGAAASGMTADAAASALSLHSDRVDALLTRLAKQGSVELDVDDAGTVRYRVAPVDTLEEEAEAGERAARRA